MYLRSLQIENYRAIRQGTLTFEETTALFGENDSGRSSVIEALALVLGAPGERFEERLQPFHFHRDPDGAVGPLRIRLRIGEETAGAWELPDCMKREFISAPKERRQFDFEFCAVLDAATKKIRHSWRMQAVGKPGRALVDKPEVLEWLRSLVPVLWLRSGPQAPASINDVGPEDPALRALGEHYRNLMSGNAPDLIMELEAGARAAQEVLSQYRKAFAGAGPLMSAMAADVLDRQQAAKTGIPGTTAAHKLGVLLLLGAIQQLGRRLSSAQAKPVLIVENPESNLHPMTIAAMWRILERITWQKVIATNSGTILANAPLGSLRRLTRSEGEVVEWSVPPRALSKDALRRISYHLRSRRASAMFARCWLLVEGETEYWILPELARLCGYDFAAEGVACVEFAQCGLRPLMRLADHLGIAWHVMADGDDAGRSYAETGMSSKGRGSVRAGQVTMLRERDIEHCFWHNGFSDAIRKVAYPGGTVRGGSPSATIKKAIERTSKPFLALSLIEAVARRGPESVPQALRQVIDSSIELARMGPQLIPKRDARD
jgi:putative ATP-dependent endonuclease of the OLD family